MKKPVTIGIIAAIIVILGLSIGTFSLIENPKNDSSKPTSEDFEDEITNEPPPPGRNLSLELEEEMGFSAP